MDRRNEPAIRFYKSLGAEAMSDWNVYRIAGENCDNSENNEKRH